MNDTPPRASIVICTRNRAALLRDTLMAMQRQAACVDARSVEIVVVDNGSTDETAEVVRSLHGDCTLRYIREDKIGLSHARNAGIEAARAEIIAFTDDDVDAPSNWLASLLEVFDRPSIAAAGGPIRPRWLAPRPAWLADEWLDYLTISEFIPAAREGVFRAPILPWGANMAFRRDVLTSLDGFPTGLGRTGTNLLSNEELLVLTKIAGRNLAIGFSPSAVIFHKIPADRLTKRWFYRRTYAQGRSDAITDLLLGRNLKNGIERRGYMLAHSLESAGPRDHDFAPACNRRLALGYMHQAMLLTLERTKPSFALLRQQRALAGSAARRAREERAWRDGDIRALHEKLQWREREINDLKTSISWRLTLPLRVLRAYVPVPAK